MWYFANEKKTVEKDKMGNTLGAWQKKSIISASPSAFIFIVYEKAILKRYIILIYGIRNFLIIVVYNFKQSSKNLQQSVLYMIDTNILDSKTTEFSVP